MELKDYSTEELKAELKRRNDLAKAEKAKVKRCRMCKHWGEITYFGGKPDDKIYYGINRCCKFFKNKNTITNSFKLVQTIIKSIKNESINTTRPRLIQQGCSRSKANRE